MPLTSIEATAPVRHAKYERLVARAKQAPSAITIVAHPCDESSLRGAVEASEAGLITPILVGPEDRIREVAQKHKINISDIEVVGAAHSEEAADKAVALI